MQAENEKIFIRKIKKGYLATFNGVKGKGRKAIDAIMEAHKNYKRLNGDNFFTEDFVDAIDYNKGESYDTTRSLN